MAEKAILFEVDKCQRCRACMVACGRINSLPSTNGAEDITVEDWVVVKSDISVYDMPPYVRYSCWHCTSPPCAARCPYNAIRKVVTGGAAEGAVVIDQDLCKPYIGDCFGQCQIYCPRGGYPKIGSATDDFLSITLDYKAWKCHLCYPHIKAGTISQPECVNACTAAALSFGDKATIEAQAQTFANYCGDGSVYWASNEHAFLPPKADPLVEDHISPMIGRILESPAGKLAVVPALLVGGLYALYQRRLSAEK